MSGRQLTLRSSFGVLTAFGLLLGSLAGCGGGDNRPARWSYIAPAIIEPNCATVSCHSAVAQRAGVILDTTQTAYTTLTGRHFFPSLISPAFAGALTAALRFSFVAYLIAAAASWLRGGTYNWSAEPAPAGDPAVRPQAVLSR